MEAQDQIIISDEAVKKLLPIYLDFYNEFKKKIPNDTKKGKGRIIGNESSLSEFIFGALNHEIIQYGRQNTIVLLPGWNGLPNGNVFSDLYLEKCSIPKSNCYVYNPYNLVETREDKIRDKKINKIAARIIDLANSENNVPLPSGRMDGSTLYMDYNRQCDIAITLGPKDKERKVDEETLDEILSLINKFSKDFSNVANEENSPLKAYLKKS